MGQKENAKMEIINAHVHLIEPPKVDQENPEELLRQMDDAGVNKSVLFAVDAPIIYSSNEYVAKLCKIHPDRFIGFASVTPTWDHNNDIARLDKAIQEYGLKGLKFHPPLQKFSPDDPMAFPLYRRAE